MCSLRPSPTATDDHSARYSNVPWSTAEDDVLVSTHRIFKGNCAQLARALANILQDRSIKEIETRLLILRYSPTHQHRNMDQGAHASHNCQHDSHDDCHDILGLHNQGIEVQALLECSEELDGAAAISHAPRPVLKRQRTGRRVTWAPTTVDQIIEYCPHPTTSVKWSSDINAFFVHAPDFKHEMQPWKMTLERLLRLERDMKDGRVDLSSIDEEQQTQFARIVRDTCTALSWHAPWELLVQIANS